MIYVDMKPPWKHDWNTEMNCFNYNLGSSSYFIYPWPISEIKLIMTHGTEQGEQNQLPSVRINNQWIIWQINYVSSWKFKTVTYRKQGSYPLYRYVWIFECIVLYGSTFSKFRLDTMLSPDMGLSLNRVYQLMNNVTLNNEKEAAISRALREI